MSSHKQRTDKKSVLTPNLQCDPELQINILLLGQTGVGKTTFINAFANYIVYDTLQEAASEEIQVIIPSCFSYTIQGYNINEDRLITIGEKDEYEQNQNYGHSGTLECRSFIFPIGDRILRFIDTPGIGDTNGIDKDEKNFQNILDYISQFEHLNAVFILLKPNEERLTVLFRYCINELLRHLHKDAIENIIFIYTSSRSTFFKPGSTKRILEDLFSKHCEMHDIIIPFSIHNSFLFDNEGFRFLALHKNGIRLDNEQTQSYSNSWNRSIEEYSRLMKHVNQCPHHAISCALSLNEAEQLVRKLPRPIAETARLIEENIQLAEEHKRKVRENPRIVSQGIPQKRCFVEEFIFQTVCTNEKCRQITGQDGNNKAKYKSICHDQCFLKGIQQEKIADELVRECQVMDPDEGFCNKCGCSWECHMHISYKFDTSLIYMKPNEASHTTTNLNLSLTDIDKRISDLREEQVKIQDVYKKMAQFLCINSLLPIDDDYTKYLEYFIHEERMKQTNNTSHTDIVANLEKMISEYKSEMEPFKKIVRDQKVSGDQTATLTPEQVFTLSGELYHLPINGKLIRAQVNSIKMAQERSTRNREKIIKLPCRAASSKVMVQLKDIVSQAN